MDKKLGIATGKGFVKGVYDEYAGNAENANQAKSLSGGWKYEGDVTLGGEETTDAFGTMTMSWGDEGELYAVKLVNRADKQAYLFMALNYNADFAGASYSTVTQIFQSGNAKLINVECTVRDISQLTVSIRRKDGNDTVKVKSYTFEVYWKKVF